jgi:hypothetical protein
MTIRWHAIPSRNRLIELVRSQYSPPEIKDFRGASKATPEARMEVFASRRRSDREPSRLIGTTAQRLNGSRASTAIVRPLLRSRMSPLPGPPVRP